MKKSIKFAAIGLGLFASLSTSAFANWNVPEHRASKEGELISYVEWSRTSVVSVGVSPKGQGMVILAHLLQKGPDKPVLVTVNVNGKSYKAIHGNEVMEYEGKTFDREMFIIVNEDARELVDILLDGGSLTFNGKHTVKAKNFTTMFNKTFN